MADEDTTSKAGTDVGLKVSRPFIDATNAADYELLFSTSWPSLPVAFETTVDISPDPTATALHPLYVATVDHNLGFYPFAMAWLIVDGRSQRVFPSVSKTQVKLSDTSNQTSLHTGKLHVKCYNIDISVQQNYPFTQPIASSAVPYDPNFGVRLAKVGKSVNSKDLRDYVIHSRGASPLILQILTELSWDMADQSIIITNPAGYTPWIFGYVKSSLFPDPDFYKWAPTGGQAYPQIKIDIPTVGQARLTLQTGDVGSIIALRDPLFSGQVLQVTY